MMNLIRMLLTERDGVSWCIGRILGAAGGIEMLAHFWIKSDASHYQEFAIGIAAIIAAIAAKNASEK